MVRIIHFLEVFLIFMGLIAVVYLFQRETDFSGIESTLPPVAKAPSVHPEPRDRPKVHTTAQSHPKSSRHKRLAQKKPRPSQALEDELSEFNLLGHEVEAKLEPDAIEGDWSAEELADEEAEESIETEQRLKDGLDRTEARQFVVRQLPPLQRQQSKDGKITYRLPPWIWVSGYQEMPGQMQPEWANSAGMEF